MASSLLGVSGVGQVLGIQGTSVSVVIIEGGRVRVVWVGDDFVALFWLLVEQLLQTDDGGQDQGNLADDQSLESDQSQESDGQWEEGSGLQLEQQEQGQEQLLDLLLLAAGCLRKREMKERKAIRKRSSQKWKVKVVQLSFRSCVDVIEREKKSHVRLRDPNMALAVFTARTRI